MCLHSASKRSKISSLLPLFLKGEGRIFIKKCALFLSDFIFPPVCLVCEEAVARKSGFLCVSCFLELDFVLEPYCIQCALPFASPHLLGERCLQCCSSPPSWRHVRAIFLYNAGSKRLIFPFKYHGNIRNILLFRKLFLQIGGDLLEEADYLIPVPLHRQKIRARGYNQAALLAKALAKEKGIKILFQGLKRSRQTRPLARLNLKERQKELKSAFIVPPSIKPLLKNKKIILVDDVLTTGMTAEFCTKILLEAGCASVDIFVIARTELGRKNNA